MNDHTTAKTPESRRPHTIYLTDQVWEALERRHLELRLAGAAPPSKIDFVEDVLRAGLEAPAASSSPKSRALGTATRRKPAPPPPPEAAERSTEAVPEAPSRPQPSPRVTPRRSAMDRLMQASDPGRPAPIQSAADPGGGKG